MANEKTAFARQAHQDFLTFKLLQREHPQIPASQKFVMLQMACEKICKAYAIHRHRKYDRDHEACQKYFGIIADQYYAVSEQPLKFDTRRLKQSLKQIAQEIDHLSPSIHKNLSRPDNCEYPWKQSNGEFIAPCDYDFPNLNLLDTPNGVTFMKIVAFSIDQLLQ